MKEKNQAPEAPGLNADQKAGLAARNTQLRAYAEAAELTAHLDAALLADHAVSLGSAKAILRGRAHAAKVNAAQAASAK